MNDKTITQCPSCKSEVIRVIKTNPPQYQCDNCKKMIYTLNGTTIAVPGLSFVIPSRKYDKGGWRTIGGGEQ